MSNGILSGGRAIAYLFATLIAILLLDVAIVGGIGYLVLNALGYV